MASVSRERERDTARKREEELAEGKEKYHMEKMQFLHVAVNSMNISPKV